MPLDHALAPLKPDQQACPAAETFIQQMRERWQAATTHLQAAQLRQKHAVDAHRREVILSVGDRVLLSTENLALRGKGVRTLKFAPRFIGPFTVIKAAGPNAYELDLPAALRIHNVINITQLRLYVDESGRFPDAPRPVVQPPPVAGADNGEPEYEVEAIIGERTFRGKHQYLVKWLGYGDYESTWLPAAQLTNAGGAIADFHQQLQLADGGLDSGE